MSNSVTQSSDAWYQDAAKAQIESERMGRAELLNGRVAMLGFLIGLTTEFLTGHGIASQITFGLFGQS
ncbi:high light inducible protein [Synechococcus sp. A15-127]|uniref:chlorophyll a/b-binding protein n=1 Tax=Synechococcus sp. A15-127 TaxID=1050624 RepID=UPI001647BC02|nr:chlorophyll a/b-binding protein [Synechococcus sp. A15-127]QNI94239.1 high light inducible protein [Synechococcus sp. A15-127]